VVLGNNGILTDKNRNTTTLSIKRKDIRCGDNIKPSVLSGIINLEKLEKKKKKRLNFNHNSQTSNPVYIPHIDHFVRESIIEWDFCQHD